MKILKPILSVFFSIITGILLAILFAFISGFKTYYILGFISAFLGLSIEIIKYSVSFKDILKFSFIALLTSIIIYVSLIIGNHNAQYCQFYFLLIVAFIAGNYLDEYTKPKLTKGILLIQCLAFLYWTFENQYYNSSEINRILHFLGICFSIYVVFLSLSGKTIHSFLRFIVSIWSAIIIAIISINNFQNLFLAETFITNIDYLDLSIIIMQFYLLGVSAMYLSKNILILLLANQFGFFLFNIMKHRGLNIEDRYIDVDTDIFLSWVCILTCISLFSLNYKFQFIDKNFLIFLVLFLLPIALEILLYVRNKIQVRNDSNNIEIVE